MKSMARRLFRLLLAAFMLAGTGVSEQSAVRTAEASAGMGAACVVTKSSSSWKSKVVALNWYKGGSKVLKKGKYGYLYDVRTGIYLKVKRMGGSAHADMEPATSADTAKLKKLSGGSYSWKRRPGILYANGKFVACSFATEPHGDQTIKDNGYDGQFCLHMVGSKTHGSDAVDEDHQAAVKKAYNWAH